MAQLGGSGGGEWEWCKGEGVWRGEEVVMLVLSLFVCAGPFMCAGPSSLFVHAGVGPSAICCLLCSSVVCGPLADHLWVVVVVALLASLLSVVLIGVHCWVVLDHHCHLWEGVGGLLWLFMGAGGIVTIGGGAGGGWHWWVHDAGHVPVLLHGVDDLSAVCGCWWAWWVAVMYCCLLVGQSG